MALEENNKQLHVCPVVLKGEDYCSVCANQHSSDTDLYHLISDIEKLFLSWFQK